MSENRDFFNALEAAQEDSITPASLSSREEITPLAPIPADVVLSEEEQKVLGKVQEYTRRGTMPATLVTRQQLIEDVLARGFNHLENIKRGPFTIARLSPELGQVIAKKSKRPDYYDFTSRVEAGYVRRRHAALLGGNQAGGGILGPDEKKPTELPNSRPTRVDGRLELKVGDKVFSPVRGAFGIAAQIEGVVEQSARGLRVRVTGGGESAPVSLSSAPVGKTYPIGNDWSVVGDPELVRREAKLSAQITDHESKREDEARVEAEKISRSILEAAKSGEGKWDPESIAVGTVLTFHGEDGRHNWVVTEIDENGDAYARSVTMPRMAGGYVGMSPGTRFTLPKVPRLTADQISGTSPVSLAQPAPRKVLQPEEIDFSYGRSDSVTVRGRKTRIQANITAIKLLKILKNEGRLASPDEKTVLARYNGWGADKEVFNDAMNQRYEDAKFQRGSEEQLRAAAMREKDYTYGKHYTPIVSWKDQYGEFHDELKGLLSGEEWEDASASTLNAHYTSEELCHGLWDIAKRAGFQGGAVLEPGMGSGRILAAMPSDLKAVSRCVGVELDSVSANISKYLFPQSEVHHCGFQDAPVLENSVDLVIANVPFSEVAPAGQTGVKLNLHNYFISRALDKLKAGGLAVIITSASTLQNNDEQRSALADKVQFLGAIRLPRDAFAENANTEVVTDVLLLRKPDRNPSIDMEQFTLVQPVKLPENGVFVTEDRKIEVTSVNEYFVRHPEMVLGEHSLNGKMYGRDNERGQYTVVSPDNAAPIGERFATAVSLLPQNIPNSSTRRVASESTQRESNAAERLAAYMDEKTGAFVMRENRVYRVNESRELVSPPWKLASAKLQKGTTAESADLMAKNYLELRDALKGVIAIDLNPVSTDNDSERGRTKLREAYKRFQDKHGEVNRAEGLRDLLGQDPDFGAVCALEHVNEVKQGRKKTLVVTASAILTTRTLRPPATPTSAESVQDGIYLSLGERGYIDPEYVAQLTGKTDADAVADAIIETGQAFRDPKTGMLEIKNKYLSGNIRRKFEEASLASKIDARYGRNVAALESVMPPKVPFAQMIVPLGASWVPTDVMTEFGRDLLKQGNDFRAGYFSRANRWMIFEAEENLTTMNTYGTKRLDGTEIFESVINQQPIRVYTKLSDDTRIFDEKESANARARADAMRDQWKRWMKDSPEVQHRLEESFNESFNSVVLPSYDGSYLQFPGLASGPNAKKPMDHQRNVVSRILSEQQGTIAHGVGYGKTISLVLAAYEVKRTGIATKPMIVCDNANYAQFVAAYRELYPQARLLCSDETSMRAECREAFLSRIATGDWDTVLVARSHFERIPVSAKTQQRFISEHLADLRATLEELDSGKERVQVRRIEKAIEKAQVRLKEQMERLRVGADNSLCWEQLGVDWLEVDESHREKKTGFSTAHGDIKGIDPEPSNRGRNMLMKARFIQDKRGGRGVIGATGTPCTNTMAEFWNALRLTAPNALKDFNVERFDEFKSAFCETVEALEMNEANGKWRNITRLSKFINGPSFIQLVRAGMDVKMNPDEVKLDLPKRKGGQIQLASVPLTNTTANLMDELAELYEIYEKSSRKREISWVPIVLMQVGMAASIDPRLVDPNAKDEPGAIVNKLVENVVRIYRETAEKRSAQVVFVDRFGQMNTTKLDELRKEGVENASIEIEDADKLPGAGAADQDGETQDEAVIEEVIQEGRFNLYHDIKVKLVALGIPEKEIAIIHDCKTGSERGALFDRLNEGDCRVVLGSSDKLGIGANFQRKLYACHHFDPSRNMTPDQMEQRTGRLIRQGNENKEVEEFYYGMEDTVTPAVFHRIQRKAAFVKQGLAAKGVGVEFEDTSEVRLEELKAALITDKRQMRRAELIAEIRDEKMRREVSFDRQRQLEQSFGFAVQREKTLTEKEIPQAQKMAAHFSKHVTPPFTAGTWSVILEDGKTINGEPKATLKELEKVVDAWKDIQLSRSDVLVRIARLNVNGLNLSVSKEQESLGDAKKTRLIVRVPNPLQAGEELSISHFGSAEALFKLVQARYENAQQQPALLATILADRRNEIAHIREDVLEHQGYDQGNLQRLTDELQKLETNMRENPYKRGQNRSSLPQVPEMPGVALPLGDVDVRSMEEVGAAVMDNLPPVRKSRRL